MAPMIIMRLAAATATLLAAARADEMVCDPLTCADNPDVTEFCNDKPEGYDEYIARFTDPASGYPGYGPPAGAAAGEIADAQEARNALRSASRILSHAEMGTVTLTKRFCGLPYDDAGATDCAPDDAMLYDSAWMQACCASDALSPCSRMHALTRSRRQRAGHRWGRHLHRSLL